MFFQSQEMLWTPEVACVTDFYNTGIQEKSDSSVLSRILSTEFILGFLFNPLIVQNSQNYGIVREW